MNIFSSPLKVSLFVVSVAFLVSAQVDSARAQQRKRVPGSRESIVVDERLSVLRATPDLSGKLVRRIGRGRFVSVRGKKRSQDGVMFYRVNVTRRTGGWIQREAVVSPWDPGNDERLLRLIKGSDDFDLIARARIFLEAFPRSPARPTVLLLFANAAEQAAIKLSQDASRRLKPEKMKANVAAPMFTYFLNYNGLDRYNRQGIRFDFDGKGFHYDGAAWREILRRYPKSVEAVEARKRLDALNQQRVSVPPA